MNEQTLFRMAMTLQSQAPNTLNKSICKLVETILFDHSGGLTLAALQSELNEQYSLSFSSNEISSALSKRAKNGILYSKGKYRLSDQTRAKLKKDVSFSDTLRKYIAAFANTYALSTDIDDFLNLIYRYLYFCFNSNVDNLLSLCNRKVATSMLNFFPATNEEISLINEFITWDNPEKDSFIYSIVSTCYDYCMLTIKKDATITKELFKGKRFYLDSNIIFRLAGVNNIERQVVTQRFVSHCRDAGISLYCTTSTIDEIYRVISAQTEYIIDIAGYEMPVSTSTLQRINPSIEINSFYKLYYDWCQCPDNHFGDYDSFNQYMRNLVSDTIMQLEFYQSSPYKIGRNSNEYECHVQNLYNYKKSKKRSHDVSWSSAQTDVTNVLDILELRHGTGTSIWQTNDYLVSADQVLISWTNESFPGVPIVVLPSVWLSIILRFNGRTDDDYKSFCLFLTQRHHIEEDIRIDTSTLLNSINKKTNNTELKERIILEITQHKADYSFASESDYESSTERAFDAILTEINGDNENEKIEMRRQLEAEVCEAKLKMESAANTRISAEKEAEREKTLLILAKTNASRRVLVFRKISKVKWLFYILAGIVALWWLVSWLWELPPFYSLLKLLPEKAASHADLLWAVFSAIIGLVFIGLAELFSNLGSEGREKRISDSLYKKYKQDSSES